VDVAERLADLCAEQGRHEDAKEYRRQANTAATATETTLDVRSGGTVLRQKTKINFGGAGLPLSELSNVAAMLRGSSAPTPVTRQKTGRNEPCPCGSGKKFKKCCGGRRSTV
jgi:preprotein translocase subunit SecA